MPRVVRNFWVAGEVDGRRTRIGGGPRARDGGVSLTLYQRDNGEVAVALKVHCMACTDGTLRLEVEPVLPFIFVTTDGRLRIETRR